MPEPSAAAAFVCEVSWPCDSGLRTEHRLECWVDPRNDFAILDVYLIGVRRRCRVTGRVGLVMGGLIQQTAAGEWWQRGRDEALQEKED